MFLYEVYASNPEGIDWLLKLQHEKKFNPDEFQDICEEALVHTLEKQYRADGVYYISSIETDYVLEYLEEKGFIRGYEITTYGIEPYWGKDSIKNKELLELINKKNHFGESKEEANDGSPTKS